MKATLGEVTWALDVLRVNGVGERIVRHLQAAELAMRNARELYYVTTTTQAVLAAIDDDSRKRFMEIRRDAAVRGITNELIKQEAFRIVTTEDDERQMEELRLVVIFPKPEVAPS